MFDVLKFRTRTSANRSLHNASTPSILQIYLFFSRKKLRSYIFTHPYVAQLHVNCSFLIFQVVIFLDGQLHTPIVELTNSFFFVKNRNFDKVCGNATRVSLTP